LFSRQGESGASDPQADRQRYSALSPLYAGNNGA
jgi:hypothetical protein